MIYTILPEKDTYVTNRVIDGFNCNSSNVGKSATLDIFKLNNETNEIKSWAILEVDNELPINEETFTLKDADNNVVVFKFVQNENNLNPGENIAGEDVIKIGLGVTPFTKLELTSQISDIINSITSFTQNGPGGSLNLNITSKSSNSILILEQNKAGISGDTDISQSLSSKLKIIKKFSRLEYSNILIKFDIDNFKDNVLTNFSNSIFSNKDMFKAEVELVDISTGHTKPSNYNLSLYPLSKSFDEGLGKDTILFEDLDSCNFITSSYDQTNNTHITWGIERFLVENIDYYQTNNEVSLESNFHVSEGNENIVFDVTNYLQQILAGEISDNGFTIRLSDSSLFDDSSYFVKRLGSKHLLNRKYVPRLNIKINNDTFYLPINNQKIQRYFNTEHDFYLFNKQNGQLKNLSIPPLMSLTNFSASLTYKDFSLIKKGLSSGDDIKTYTNIFGSQKPGIYKFTVTEDEINRFNNLYSDEIETSTSGSLTFDLDWYWFKEGETPEKRNIKTEKILFQIPENTDFLESSIISKITVNNFNMIADDSIHKISIFFIDTKEQYKANKKPYDIQCKFLENVHIKVIDTFDNSVLLNPDLQKNSTKLFFNGKNYEYDMFVSSLFKNKTIQFEFVIFDEITDTFKTIKDLSKIKVL